MENKTENTTTVKDTTEKNTAPLSSAGVTVENVLMDQLKDLKDEIKQRDQKIEELTKKLTESKEVELIVDQDVSSVYQNVELMMKKEYTWEEAEDEFQKRLELLKEHKGTPAEQFYGGNKPTDMGAAEHLYSRGLIKSLKDFYKVKKEAAEREERWFR